MRKTVVVLTIASLLAGAVASAQMKVQPQPQNPVQITPGGPAPLVPQSAPAQFPRISIADAYKMYKENKAVFIDVRSNEQYQLGHIKGALSIPGSQLVKRYAEVTPGKTVITYCACSAEQSSGRAASTMIAHGAKNIFALKGGWNDWKSAGYPTATGPK